MGTKRKERGDLTMGRAPCCDKSKVKKGPWSPEEDLKLREFIEKNGTGGNWIALPQKAGLRRCGKSCRLRWLNYLRPNIKHGGFSDDEDKVICTLFATIGSRWSIIAAQLPGRIDNDIKNYWNTKLKKKLLGIPGSQRKSNQQIKQQQQQQQQQQLLFPPVLDNRIANMAPSIISSTLPSLHLFKAHQAPCQYQMIKEEHGSNLLTFGGHEQNCSSSDGLGFENNYIYGGFEGTHGHLVGDNNQEASLDLYGNYGGIKHVFGISDCGYSAGLNLQEPSSANISFKAQETDMYSYNYSSALISKWPAF